MMNVMPKFIPGSIVRPRLGASIEGRYEAHQGWMHDPRPLGTPPIFGDRTIGVVIAVEMLLFDAPGGSTMSSYSSIYDYCVLTSNGIGWYFGPSLVGL